MPLEVCVRVPATTANLGPGFDCLGLALDLWNVTTLRLAGAGVSVRVRGEGADVLPQDAQNLVARAALAFFRQQGARSPDGLHIECDNAIPLGSGLGSSGAAVLAGLLGANALLGNPAGREEILRLAVEIEGHADNAAAALEGGLVIVAAHGAGFLTRRVDVPALPVTVVLPAVDLPTRAARAALPASVPLADAVFNLGRAALVVEALRAGDLALLGQVMDDRLHQPYRYPLIPGAQSARDAALAAGAAAAGLSGAGPSLAAFGGDPLRIAPAMQAAFQAAGLNSRAFLLKTSPESAGDKRKSFNHE
jgi:homoserine kinase